jgi:hypothetical protein
VGVAALGLGAGAMIPGAILASRPPKPFPGERRMDVLRDLRPAGYAVLGVAGALLVTGAVLFIVERRRAPRQRSLGRSWLPHATFSIAMPPRW